MDHIRRQRKQKVSCTVKVTAYVQSGVVTDAEFAEWLEHAVRDYHKARAGFVGIGAHAGIHRPTVSVVSRDGEG